MALMGLLPRLLLALVLPLASASPSPPSRPRDGAAPPGVPLAAALATARALQPELFGALPASFLPQFRANCWYLNSTGGAATALDAAVGSQLRCLPSFFVLGSFQCGVRDLASRLAHHPLVAAAPSPHWWDESKPWSAYWPHFSQAAARADRGEAGLHVGDSSAATFAFMWSASQRTNRPFSEALQRCAAEGCAHDTACVARRCYAEARGAWHPLDGDGSKLSTPWLVRLALGGGVRHVVLLRDPVERLHAAFWAGHHYHARYGASEAGFAAFANETLADFAACERAGHGRDGCALAFEAWGKEQEAAYFHCDQLVKGAYVLYLRQWLAAFPPGAVLVLRLEDYAALASTPAEMAEAGPSGRLGAARALRRVFDHLGLPQPPAAAAGEAAGGWWAAALGAPVARGSHPREATPQRSPPAGIDPAVRSRVAAFYAPFDAELEALLGVNGFARWHTPLPG